MEMDERMDQLARLVRSERKRRNWRQKELAEMAGFKEGALSNFERRVTNLSPAHLREVLRILELEEAGGEAVASQTREAWPRDVKTFLNMMGLALTSLPEDRREEVMFELTRYAMSLARR